MSRPLQPYKVERTQVSRPLQPYKVECIPVFRLLPPFKAEFIIMFRPLQPPEQELYIPNPPHLRCLSQCILPINNFIGNNLHLGPNHPLRLLHHMPRRLVDRRYNLFMFPVV